MRHRQAALDVLLTLPGDFNADGRLDLAVSNWPNTLYVTFGKSLGFDAGRIFDSGDKPTAIASSDFNSDGNADIVLTNDLTNGTISVFLGNGNGTFQQSFRITENAVNSPLNIAVADYNRDGFQDIARAMGNGSFGLFEIANGNGDGTFRPVVQYLRPPNGSSLGGIVIIASDFNGDTPPDIALLVGGAGPSLRVAINTTGAPPPTAL